MKISLLYKVVRKEILIALVLAVQPIQLISQETKNDSGSIRIIQDNKVSLLVSKHVQINQLNKGIEGFRIQVFFDSGNNSKTNARSIYDSFISKYPTVRAYITFKAPNYKVRVGDFRTKLDAQRFLNEIIADYPNAWIIADQINLPQVEPY